MKKVLSLILTLNALVSLGQSKKEQIIILNNRVDSFKLALSEVTQTKLRNEKRDALKIIDLNNSIKNRDITNAELKQKIEDIDELNKTLRAEIENKNLKIDSIVKIVAKDEKEVSNTMSDFDIKEYVKLDSLCLEYSKYKQEVFLVKENNNEDGAVMRFHKNGQVAKISVGSTACGDCGSFYCVYFNNQGKLMREELRQWCALEGESEPTYGVTIISYLKSEFGNSFPNKIIYNFNADYISDYVQNWREFRDGEIHCCWLRTTEQKAKGNMAFTCLNL